MKVELVQRTPVLLAYAITAQPEHPGGAHTISGALMIEHASAWRDRGIHKLLTTPVTTQEAALRLFGYGLIAVADVGVMRGRLSMTPLDAHPWGVRPMMVDRRIALVVSTWPVERDAVSAIVTVELERSR